MMNYAVIGRNFVADWFIEAAGCFDELCLYGIYSRNEATGIEYASKHGAKKIFTSISSLCEDRDIDFVYIASPNVCHEEQAIALLNAGKHILVEKPAAPSADAFCRMSDAAKRNGCVLMEAMVPAHMPSVALLYKALAQIGTVRRATLTYCQYSSRYDKFKRGIIENAFKPELCNGSLMDIGVYCAHLAVLLFGEPQSVTGCCVFLPDSIDGEGTILLKYPDKLTELIYSKITDSALETQIQGENGSVFIDSMSRPKKFTVALRSGERTELDFFSDKPDMYYEIEDFIKQINGEKMPQFNSYTLTTLKIMDEARDIMNIKF